MSPSKPSSNTLVISIFVALGLWLMTVLIALSWFQSRYIHEFTQQQPSFLQASYTEQWFNQLLTHLPPKTKPARVIQLWLPDCLCNRFARPHALKAMDVSDTLNYEHITLIPNEYAQELPQLQALNPQTQIVDIDTGLLKEWPANPSVLIEGPLSQLLYIGPLGFGAFCSQATTSVIESQLLGVAEQTSRAFYNQVGQGCFCQWPSEK
jgi:hypothetical protein